MNKTIINFIVLITFSTFLITLFPQTAQAGYVEIPKFLYEKGVKYFQDGDYVEALAYFNKSLLANRHGKFAQLSKMYIEIIQGEQKPAKMRVKRIPPEKIPPEEELLSQEEEAALAALEKELAIQKAMLEVLEKERREQKREIPSYALPEPKVEAAKKYEYEEITEEPQARIAVEKAKPIEVQRAKPIAITKPRPVEIRKIPPPLVEEETPQEEAVPEPVPYKTTAWPEEEVSAPKQKAQLAILAELEERAAPEEIQVQEKLAEIEEVKQEIAVLKKEKEAPRVPPAVPTFVEETAPIPQVVPAKQVTPVEFLKDKLVLYEDIDASRESSVIELESNKALVVEGVNIQRWLSTVEGIVGITRRNANAIEVRAEKIGSTYVHVWDNDGRWTLRLDVISPKYIGELVEKYKRELEQVKPFKFNYAFLRNSFHSGDGGRPGTLERNSLTFDQWLGLTGETPYGDFDTLAKISKLRETTDLTYLTMGLRNGKIGGIEDFDLRGFDFSASGSDLTFPGESLRGVRFDKRAFEKLLDYSVFWGREGQGKFGNLSPGLADPLEAYIAGTQFRVSPWNNFDYYLSSYWGYGDDRTEGLKDNVWGFGADYRPLKNVGIGADFGWDLDNLAYTLDSTVVWPRLRLSGEFRDINEKYETIDGRPNRSGEIGAVVNADYTPTEKIYINANAGAYKDRLFPNPDDPDKLNYDLGASTNLTINDTTSTRLAYQHTNEEGKLSPRIANNFSAGLSKSFPELKALSTYLQYNYRDSENPDSPGLDYYSNGLTAGLNLRLISNLNYYASQNISWLTEELSGAKSRPMATETGLDYSSQIFTLPLYTTLRLNYRNEENAQSTLSYLSGEDSIGFFGELSYRPMSDFELFVSTNIRNYWAQNPGANDRIEAELRLGGKARWDTGLHWNPVGTIEGTVYRDLNDDGAKQDDEPGVKEAKLTVGDKEVLTDPDGFYSASLRAKKAKVTLDAGALPAGVVISDAGSKEVDLLEDDVVIVDFRLISRSEIYGVIFCDDDGDGKYDITEKGIQGIKVTLEDGKVAITDNKGQYYFRKISAGDHTLNVILDSIPLDYLPQVPLLKQITLFEGITYVHNVPLKRAK